MPAYKAAATVARTVADIPAGVADQLILVDDASPDDTAAVARELGLDVHVHAENRGYGANQKTCYTIALDEEADVVVMLHPDYQYEPKAVPLLIAPILAGDADMTFGSRFAGLGDPRAGGMPLHRFLGNRVTTVVENALLGSRFTEMHSGMRAYTRECLLALPFLRYSDDFTFDSQLLIDAVTTGQRVVEVPIPTRYTEESSSIGALRSLSYVARSVAYCAARVFSHGRRGHRSPLGRKLARRPVPNAVTLAQRFCPLCAADRSHVVRRSSEECRECGLVSPTSPGPDERTTDSQPLLEVALSAIRGYVFRGRQVLTSGRLDERLTDSADCDWSVLDLDAAAVGSNGGGGQANTVVVSILSSPDLSRLAALGGIRGLRELLARDGLLAVFASPVLPDSGHPYGSSPYSLRATSFEQALAGAGFRLVEWTRIPGERRPSSRRGPWSTVARQPGLALAVARLADVRAPT